MHILFVSPPLHKQYGGPPVAVVGACVGLRNLGHEISLMVFGQGKASIKNNSDFYIFLEKHDVRTIIAKKYFTSKYGGIGNISDICKLWSCIRVCDVVSAHSVYTFQNFLVSFMCKLLKKPFAIMPHGTLTQYQRQIHKKRKKIIKPFFDFLVLNRASGILVASQMEKEQIPAALKSKSYVVGLGFPNTKLKRKKYFNAGTDFTFLYMGRITPKKRLDIAIEAFSEVAMREKMSIKFKICGDGLLRDVNEIAELINKLPNRDKIFFEGWVSGEKKSRILEKSNCFILTSEDENFAIAVAEALSYGIPCIVSQKVALSEIVSQNQAGVVFEELSVSSVADAMKSILQLENQFLRKMAFSASDQLTWESVSRKWSEALTYITQSRL